MSTPLVEAEPRLESVSGQGVTWIDIEKPTPKELGYLAHIYPFHPLDLEDCLSKRQLPKIDEYPDYLFILLHFPLFNRETRYSQPSQVSLFLGKNYLVTVHQGELKPLVKLFRACQQEEKTRQEYLGRDSGYLFYRLLDILVDYCFPILSKVMDNLDALEDKVYDPKVDAAREVAELRRDIAGQRKIIWGLRGVGARLQDKVQHFTQDDLSLYFSDVMDHMERVWSTLEECKETVEIYKDTDFLLSQERTNKILAVLTILFTISIPAAVVGTFYGMNVNLPGGMATGNWNFLGPFTTFLVILGLALLPAGAMLYLFHRLGWL